MKIIFLLSALCAIIVNVNGNNSSFSSRIVQDRSKISITESNKGGEHYAGELIFEDTFDYLDFEKWQHENTLSGGGNWEFQVYHNSRTNSFVRDGILHLKPTLTSDRHSEDFLFSGTLSMYGGAPADECTNPSFYGCERVGGGNNILNPTMSARLRTVDSFYFKYGRIEVRAKIPSGDWIWPAIWMMPRFNAYGTWPASGEIDIMESRGNKQLFNEQGVNVGSEQVSSTLHYGPFFPHNGYDKAHFERNSNPGWDTDFHNYQCEWTLAGLRFSIDDVFIGAVVPPAGGFWELGGFSDELPNPWKGNAENERMAPFDQKFYLILNVAIGGTNGFFPDTTNGPNPKPWLNTSPQAFLDFWNGRGNWLPTWNGDDASMQIDHVRVWAV